MQTSTLTTGLIVLAVIVSATVAVVTNHLDGATFAALLGSALGLAGGAGAHAAGVKQATAETP